MMELAVLLPNPVLIELFGRPDHGFALDSVEGMIGQFSRKLASYAEMVSETLAMSRDNSQKASQRLEMFLQNLSNDEHEKDLGLVFDLIRDADSSMAKRLLDRLSDQLVLRMLRNNPGAVRNGSISPERLLQALGITPRRPQDGTVAGLKALFQFSSGNFQIDKPFTALAYEVIANVAIEDPRVGLQLLRESEVPILDFIRESPKASVGILSSDLPGAASLVANIKGYANSPPHIVHGLVAVDPMLAARIVIEMDEQGRDDLATESLIVFAFDETRSRVNPSLGLSLRSDGEFLEHLIDFQGEKWARSHIVKALRM